MGLATSRVCHVCGGEIDPQRTERGLSARVGSFGSESCVGNAAAPHRKESLAGGEFSDSCEVSPGCGSRSSFREVVCLRFTPRRVPTHGDPHAFSLCGSACAGQNAPPSGSLARPRPGSGRPGLAFFPPRCFVPLHLPGTRTGPEAASSLYTWGRRTGPDASAVTPEPRGPPGGRTRAGVWGRQGTAR